MCYIFKEQHPNHQNFKNNGKKNNDFGENLQNVHNIFCKIKHNMQPNPTKLLFTKSPISNIIRSFYQNFHVLKFRLLLIIDGIQTYNCSIIIFGVETPLSIINLIVTIGVRTKQKQGSIMFYCNDKNHSSKSSRCV